MYEYANEGIDTIERAYESLYLLENNVENLVLVGEALSGNGNGLDNVITGNAGNNSLQGLAGNDTLIGLEGGDNLFGGAGDDVLDGGAGDDYLDGGTGADLLTGGLGNDNYVVDHEDDVVVEAASGGEGDMVQASVTYTLSDNVESLFLTGGNAIDGSGNALDNYLSGNTNDNVLFGAAGSDTILGGGGNDTLIGGAGDDMYLFSGNEEGTAVIDNTGGGFDGIYFMNGVIREQLGFSRDGNDLLVSLLGRSEPSIRVRDHFLAGDAAIDFVALDGNVYISGTEIIQIVSAGGGSQFDQVITGTAAGEQLLGNSGKDLIQGLAGDDELFGFAGNDTLRGDEGDDYLSGGNGSGVGSGNDRLEGGVGADILNGEDGTNTLLGGAGDDAYLYDGGQDIIDNTGGGFDQLFFNDHVVEDLAFTKDGNDLLITVHENSGTSVRVINHFLGGDYAIDMVRLAMGAYLDTAAINAIANPGGDSGGGGNEGDDSDYPNVVSGTPSGEQLFGSSGRDLIKGEGGDDYLFGFGNDDKLVGGDGADYLSGGNGTFSGSGSDILIGGAGDDTLVGEDGDDMLIGGAGNDFYYFAQGSDFDTVDNVGGGTDYLYFADVDRNRLSYHQDGEDLVVLVDGDLSQGFRVLNHFLGGESAIAYVQPASGYAISAAQIAAQLTPLPNGLMGRGSGAASFAQTLSVSAFRNGEIGQIASMLESSAPPPDLNQIIAAMARFRGCDAEPAELPSRALHQPTQLTVSAL
ncbi:calcium-binding protein [Pseudoxanthomonas suwonensis]